MTRHDAFEAELVSVLDDGAQAPIPAGGLERLQAAIANQQPRPARLAWLGGRWIGDPSPVTAPVRALRATVPVLRLSGAVLLLLLTLALIGTAALIGARWLERPTERPGASLVRIAGLDVSLMLPAGLADRLPAHGDAVNGITWGSNDHEYGRTGSRWRSWALYAPGMIDDPARGGHRPLPSDPVAWLRQVPGLTVLAERDIEVGGKPARLLDVVRPGEGASFTFELPVGDSGATPAFAGMGGTHNRMVIWQLGYTWMVAQATASDLNALATADPPDDPFMRFIADMRFP